MAIFSRIGLITELLDRTELLKATTQTFLRLTDEQLLLKPGMDKWSIVDVYGHLNLFLDQYIRSILSRISLAPDTPSDTYRSSWFGDRIYELIMPRPDGSVFRLKARKSLCPDAFDGDVREELYTFQRHCDALDDILRHVATKDLRRICIPYLQPGLLYLRLGDMLRCIVAHGERHLLQAQRVMTVPGQKVSRGCVTGSLL